VTGPYPGPELYPGVTLWPGVPDGSGPWQFAPPTVEVVIPIAGRGLRGIIPYGQSVWQDADGVWHTQLSPAPEQLVGALHYWRGGSTYLINSDERAALIAGGLGSYITDLGAT
jgi:hypothetical protein